MPKRKLFLSFLSVLLLFGMIPTVFATGSDIEEIPEVVEIKDTKVNKETPIKEEPLIEEIKEDTKNIQKETDPLLLKGLDFSSKRLLIITSDKSEIKEGSNVVSEYNDIFLISYETEEEAKEAYLYYKDIVDFIEPDRDVYISTDTTTSESTIDDIDPIAELKKEVEENSVMIAERTPVIALLDTGSSESTNIIGSATVLGDDGVDRQGHATSMVQYIAEEYPTAKILSVKVCDDNGKGSIASIVAGIEYTIEQGADIINLSVSARTSAEDSVFVEQIRKAIAANITVVGAAGNDGYDVKYYVPGRFDEAIVIGACNETGERKYFSNYGDTIDYYTVAESTSEATARFSGMFARNVVNTFLNKEKVFTAQFVQEGGSVIKDPETEGFPVLILVVEKDTGLPLNHVHISLDDTKLEWDSEGFAKNVILSPGTYTVSAQPHGDANSADLDLLKQVLVAKPVTFTVDEAGVVTSAGIENGVVTIEMEEKYEFGDITVLVENESKEPQADIKVKLTQENYLSKNNNNEETLFTNEQGEVIFKNRLVKHLSDTAEPISINITAEQVDRLTSHIKPNSQVLDPTQKQSAVFTNEMTSTRVRVVDEDNEILKGSMVEVLNAENEKLIDFEIADINTLKGLEYGNEYILRQTKSLPTHIQAQDKKITYTEDMQEIEILNNKTITTFKIMDENDNLMSGLKAKLYKGSELVEEWIVDGKEHIVEKLEKGVEYTLKQEALPETNNVMLAEKTFTISSVNPSNIVTIQNTLKEVEPATKEVSIIVVDSKTNKAISGVPLQILSNGSVIHNLLTTLENTIVELSVGEYTIKQSRSTTGYTKMDHEQPLIIKEDLTVDSPLLEEGRIVIKNAPMVPIFGTTLTVKAVDEYGNLIPNVTYAITREQDDVNEPMEFASNEEFTFFHDLGNFVLKTVAISDEYVKQKDIGIWIDVNNIQVEKIDGVEFNSETSTITIRYLKQSVSPTPTPTPVPTPTPTPTSTPTPTPTPTATPTPEPTPTPTPEITPTPTPSVTPTPTPIPTVTPTPTPTATPQPSSTPKPTATPSPTPSATPTPTPEVNTKRYLTFKLNGGSYNGSTEDIVFEYEVGDTIRLPGAPKKQGYVFDYWKGSRYDAGAEYKVEGDHTFEAQWKKAEVVVVPTPNPVPTSTPTPVPTTTPKPTTTPTPSPTHTPTPRPTATPNPTSTPTTTNSTTATTTLTNKTAVVNTGEIGDNMANYYLLIVGGSMLGVAILLKKKQELKK